MYSEFKKMLEDVMRLATITGGVGVDKAQSIEEFAAKFKIDCARFPLKKIAQGGANAALKLSHIQHLYEILERRQIKQVLDYLKDERPEQTEKSQERRDRIANYQFQVNIKYHVPLTPEQREAIGNFCAEFVDDIPHLVILIQGLLRMVLRQMCGAGA